MNRPYRDLVACTSWCRLGDLDAGSNLSTFRSLGQAKVVQARVCPGITVSDRWDETRPNRSHREGSLEGVRQRVVGTVGTRRHRRLFYTHSGLSGCPQPSPFNQTGVSIIRCPGDGLDGVPSIFGDPRELRRVSTHVPLR